MKPRPMSGVYETTLCRENNGVEEIIPVKVEWRVADDSIGGYEFQGQRCVDPHDYYVEIENVADYNGEWINVTDQEKASLIGEIYDMIDWGEI